MALTEVALANIFRGLNGNWSANILSVVKKMVFE